MEVGAIAFHQRQVPLHYLPERDFFIDNLLVRIHFVIVMIWLTGLAPWEFEFPFPGSLTSTFLVQWFRGGLVFEAHRLVYHSA